MTLLHLSLLFCSITAQPSVFTEGSGESQLSSGLLTSLVPAVTQAAAVEGADMAVGLVDMATGERLIAGDEGLLDMGNPELPILACAVDLVIEGSASLEDMPGREETVEDLIRETARGRADPGINLHHYIGPEQFEAWLLENELTEMEYHGFQLHFERAPEVDQNMATVNDLLTLLVILDAGIDVPRLRGLLHHDFPFGPAILSDSEGAIPYGTVSFEEEGESIGVIGVLPDGSRIGVAVIASEPCCNGKAELAFMMVWNEMLRQISP